MTQAEARLRGPDALRKHIRRHGQPIGKGGEMPPAPDWLSPGQRVIWDRVLAHAPAGVLHASDHPNAVVLVIAIDRFNTLACQVAEYGAADPPMRPPADLARALRLAGAEVGRASAVLNLTPARRGERPAVDGSDEFVLIN